MNTFLIYDIVFQLVHVQQHVRGFSSFEAKQKKQTPGKCIYCHILL